MAPVQLGEAIVRGPGITFGRAGPGTAAAGFAPCTGLTLGPQHSSAGGGQQRLCSRTGHGPGQAAKHNVAAGVLRLCVSLSGGLGDDSAGSVCCVMRSRLQQSAKTVHRASAGAVLQLSFDLLCCWLSCSVAVLVHSSFVAVAALAAACVRVCGL